MERTLRIPAREMTPELMMQMEKEGLIERLSPRRHVVPAEPGETVGASLYEGVDGYGPHKIITITVNRKGFAGFGTHPDCEEFWLIGDNDTRPMYILIARMSLDAFNEKAASGTLTADDFYLLRARYNDPEVSFFIMLPLIPHGEGIWDDEGALPTFYVTESRDLPLDLCSFGDYTVDVIRE